MNFERYTSSNCIIKIENILKIEVRTERLQKIVYAAKTDISMYFCFRGFIFIFCSSHHQILL